MDYQYKIVIRNRRLYKEIEILPGMERVKIGTTSACEVRLNPDVFFDSMELDLEKTGSGWEMTCTDSIYISRGDMRKLLSAELIHGDVLELRYAQSGDVAAELRFIIDFEAKAPFYNWKINLSEKENWIISGEQRADLMLTSAFSQKTAIHIYKEKHSYILEELSSEFGVYRNGKQINENLELTDNDFISVADFSFYYKDGSIYFDKNNVVFREINVSSVEAMDNSLLYPLFNRNTRLKSTLSKEKIDILVPPSVPQKPEENLVMTLMPALAMLALTVVVRGFMGNASGSSYIIFSVCSMSLGIFTSVATHVRTKKKYQMECRERIEQYTEYIEEKKAEISQIRQAELNVLNEIYHDISYDLKVVENFSAELFDRVLQDEDFLKVYIGRGEVESLRQVDYKEKETFETNDELMEIPLKIAKDFKYIGNAPITIDLKNANAVGIVGKKDINYIFLKNIIIDLVTRHYYGDVKLVLLLDEDTAKYDWLKFLPHVFNALSTRSLVYDNETKNSIFELLYKELSFRKEQKSNAGAEYLIVLVMDEHGLKNHPLAQFIAGASLLNATFVFFEQYREQLPLCCNEIIELADKQTGVLCRAENRNYRRSFWYEAVSDVSMEKLCKKLAPVYCEEITLESSLRKNISLFELLHIYSVEDIDLKGRWEKSQVYNSMAVPLGVNAKDEIVYLNLHEKAHGPHGLVAGTTGSGKSEILQTFILAAATLFHPYEISFVIIDFKGGGMVNQFKMLPHLIGAITNIDGREIDRSLKSIKAELLKRQALFAEANVNHIDKYIKLFKEGKVKTALPHLVIIVDEFAELKAEQPEFMKELISAARIGRSLGVHLILATQKPSGQVNEQIWSNSKFKLCLKVQNKEDSNEVLKTPVAAEIKEPGRAYLQVGNNEIFELLQSAYSGAPEKNEDSAEKEFVISAVEFSGKRTPVFVQKKNGSDKSNRTQLEAIVDYVGAYCRERNIAKLPNICMPPLPECIIPADGAEDYTLNAIPIGIYDDPDSQYQGEARFNFCEENTMIIGSSATGKTNLLQVIIRQLAARFSPKEVNIYIMDFGAMYLKNFEALQHVGGVVTISDEEKLRNLFKLLLEEIQFRKARFLEMGISSFSAYKEAGYTEFPHIFLMIDNFTAFKEIYADAQEDNFIYITREGLSCGISVIVANSQTSGLGYKYMSNFACRLALHNNDSGEYSSLLDRCRIQPKDVPGRALCKMNKELYELQTFLAFEGQKEIDRSKAIKAFIESVNASFASEHAKLIPTIPSVLTYDYIRKNFKYKKKRYEYPVALDYATVDVVALDFGQVNELCIIGNDRTGRMKALASVFKSIEQNLQQTGVKTYIIDNVERTLKEKAGAAYVEQYTIDCSAAGEIITKIAEDMEHRYEMLVKEGMEALSGQPMYLVIVNSKEAIEYISSTKSVLEAYNKIVKQYKALGICFVYADIEDAPVAYNGPELMKRFKDNKKAFIMTPSLKEFKFCDIPSSVIRTSRELKNGDAYLLNGTVVQRVKLVEAE